jgi:hypothetical protein
MNKYNHQGICKIMHIVIIIKVRKYDRLKDLLKYILGKL